MQTREQQLKNRIMTRIYGIWFIRRGIPMLAGSALFITAALKLTAERFFVAQIWRNFEYAATSDIMSLPRFIASALNSAEPALLMFISAVGITGFVLAVKLLRSIRSILMGSRVQLGYQSRR
ncbi:MAG: hypothetical protein UW30_C0023G0009 [Candidatus Giovannonibacteria bacterium GW2011_GWA2_44_13b]|uniref:Uncharacterized protein n=1 Tax=Candidatus Giovannonibacteria bacterium GW2011_GWA2_44_13b TaxID=1618647 RepID=A0A0G1GYM1_9BACT|nr:MAG: hypothetical protein UW30_C0023G0009 [Candidatus Giovannonibacteria bacterium GW2011_GWA2_44_13b]